MNKLLQKLKQTFLQVQNRKSSVVLFDSITSAADLALMLGGEWDNCNSITLTNYDQIALETAAALVQSQWCHCGESIALLPKLTASELIKRYQAGEKNFINANLRCSDFSRQCLRGVSFSYAFLNQVNLSHADLSEADLSTADLSDADLNHADLSNTNLFRANLTGANLHGANLSGAKLNKAFLNKANLSEANLNGADLSLADLRGTNLDNVSLDRANLTGTMLTMEQLPS